MPCRGVRGSDPTCRHVSRRNRARVARNAHRGGCDGEHAEIMRSVKRQILLASAGHTWHKATGRMIITERSLSGAKRTLLGGRVMSAPDPGCVKTHLVI